MNRRVLETFGSKLRQGYRVYDSFMEKQGFSVVLCVCVLIIVFSALYTFQMRNALENPNLTEAQQQAAQSVGSSHGTQTLREAQALIASKSADAPLAVPTPAVFTFLQPAAGFVSRVFSEAEPQYFARSNTWQVHLGLDLEVEFGTIVSACAAGKVLAVKQDSLLGHCIAVVHDNGYESLYAGLNDVPYLRAGDPVAAGQTLGHAGNGVLFEADAKPHLHLEVRKDGKPVDPLPLFLGVEK